MPTDDELKVMYSDSYFGEGGAWVCAYWKGSYIDNEQNLRREAGAALAELGLPSVGGNHLLEIGSAGGFFLDEARRSGYDVLGIELNESMAEFARDHLRLDVRSELFETAPLESQSFDVIVAQDVLEHVRDLQLFVRRVADLLQPGGVFFVRGPLEQSLREVTYLALRKYVRRETLVLQEQPYHLQGFCRASFERLLRHAGLAVVDFRATSPRPHWHGRTPKETIATTIEMLAHIGDLVRGGGEFMTARATKKAMAAPLEAASPS